MAPLIAAPIEPPLANVMANIMASFLVERGAEPRAGVVMLVQLVPLMRHDGQPAPSTLVGVVPQRGPTYCHRPSA
jgi:hypothetical protein